MSRVDKATECALALAISKNSEVPFRGDLDMLAWKEFRRCGGMNLDPGLWHLENGAEDALAEVVERCLTDGIDPFKAVSFWLFETDAAVRYLRREVDDLVRDQYGAKWARFDDFITMQVGNWFIRIAHIRNVATGMIEPSELETFPRLVPHSYQMA